MIASLLAVDTAAVTLAQVEHILRELDEQVILPDDVTVCTHEIRDGEPHYAISVSFPTPPRAGLVETITRHFAGFPCTVIADGAGVDQCGVPIGLARAVSQAFAADGGRAVIFPGSRRLVGSLTVGEALEVSALHSVAVLGGTAAAPDAALHSRGFVRPLWRQGELVLSVLPAGDGALAPFEVPNPTPCCAEHG